MMARESNRDAPSAQETSKAFSRTAVERAFSHVAGSGDYRHHRGHRGHAASLVTFRHGLAAMNFVGACSGKSGERAVLQDAIDSE
jgi:hypothetical protein